MRRGWLEAYLRRRFAWLLAFVLLTIGIDPALEQAGLAARGLETALAIPRMTDAPRVEIAILDRRDVPPAGAGETALIASTLAIANALRDVTGCRWTRSSPRRPPPDGVGRAGPERHRLLDPDL